MDDLSKVRELTRRYFDGLLAPGESEELQRLLREESAADEFARLSRLEADLGEMFAHEQGVRRESAWIDAVRRSGRRRRVVKWAVAAALLLAVLGPLAWWLSQPPPRAEVIAGAVDRGEAEWRVTSPEAEVRLPDGSRAFLKQDALVARPDELRLVELREGEGRFVVRPAPEPFVVRTPAGSVTALGTEFSVTLDPDEEDDPMKLTHWAMAVAVMSGVVQVDHDGALTRMTGGQSRAFGQERGREERKPAPRSQRAVVVSAGDGKLTVIAGRSEEKTVEIGKDVKVFVDGKEAKLSDLAKDMVVSIEYAAKDGPVVAVRTEAPVMGAVVRSVSKDKIVIEGRGRNRDASEELPLAKDVKVLIGRKEAKLEEIEAGVSVNLTLTVDRKTVVAIARGAQAAVAARVREGRPAGVVKAVDAKAGTLTFEGGRGDREFAVSKDAKITIDGKPAKLADVKPGAVAVLVVDREGRTATAVTIVGDRVSGRVREAKDGTIKLLTGGTREKPEERQFTLAKDAKVTIDGKAAKLEDVKEGAVATLVLSQDNKTAVEIIIAAVRKRER